MNKKSNNAFLKKLCLFFSLVLVVVTGLSSCASFYYSLAVERHDNSGEDKPVQAKEDMSPMQKQAIETYESDLAWFKQQPYQSVSIESRDGLKLAGYWLPALDAAGQPSRNTAILLHGYSGNAFTMLLVGKTYYENFGFNILLIDARGHGASEGDYIGFGWPERLDVIDWANQVVKMVGSDSSIVLHGVSMGGATVMMASGEELPSQIKCIIEDCGYTSVWDELDYQMTHFRNIKHPDAIIKQTSRYTKRKAGYDFEEASAIKQVAKAKVPMLFIHGGADTFVPTKMVYQLYDACPTDKEILIVEGAEHAMSCIVDGDAYDKKVSNFLHTHGFSF